MSIKVVIYAYTHCPNEAHRLNMILPLTSGNLDGENITNCVINFIINYYLY